MEQKKNKEKWNLHKNMKVNEISLFSRATKMSSQVEFYLWYEEKFQYYFSYIFWIDVDEMKKKWDMTGVLRGKWTFLDQNFNSFLFSLTICASILGKRHHISSQFSNIWKAIEMCY